MKTAKNLVLTSIILVAGVMMGVIAAPNLAKLNVSQLLGTTETAATDTTAPAAEVASATPSTNPADLNDLTPAAGVEDKAVAEKTAEATTDTAEPKMTEVDLNKKTSGDFDLEAALADRVMGNPDAPITIYDYSSLSCPHCMHFHNDFLPTIKKEFIDTGKAKLIFRGFPLNEAALQAEMLARCAPADQYYNMLQMFFDAQENWLSNENPKQFFRQMVKIAGFNDEKFDACLANKELEAGIIAIAQQGTEKHGIDATPSFVIEDSVNDNELIKGLGLLETFKQNLNQRYEVIQNEKEATTEKKTDTTDRAE